MRPIDISSLMANDTFLRDWVLAGEQDVGQITDYLSRIKDEYDFFTAFFISEVSGNYYYYDGILKTVSQEDAHDVWYYTFKETGADVDLDVDADEASAGALTIFVNHRVLDGEGNLIGVTGVGLGMSGISELLADYKTRFGRLVYMIDSHGVVQAHPDVSLVESMSIVDTEGIRVVSSAILAQQGEESYEFDRAGKHVLAEARFFPEFEWYLIAEQETGTSMGRIRSALVSNLLIGLLATMIAISIVVPVVNRYQRRLEALVSIDPLTGVANRRHFMAVLQTEFARSRRYEREISLLMIDVDRFKRVNDQHGHLVGDRLLVMLAQDIQGALRDSDTLGRLGGEEFGVVLPDTQLAEAVLVAERIRTSVRHRHDQEPGSIHLQTTVSVGVVSMHPGISDYEDLYHLADVSLYRAKEQGRDRICISDSQVAKDDG